MILASAMSRPWIYRGLLSLRSLLGLGIQCFFAAMALQLRVAAMIVVNVTFPLSLKRVSVIPKFLLVTNTQCFFAAMGLQLLAAKTMLTNVLSQSCQAVCITRKFLLACPTQCFFATMAELFNVAIYMMVGQSH